MSLRTIRVLITGAGATGVYGVVKALRANGEREVDLLGVDIDPDIASRYFLDRFYLVSRRTDPAFIPRILEIVQEDGVDVVFPVPTAELEMFAQNRAQFEALGRPVVVSEARGLQVANNKALLYQHLQGQGLPCVPIYRLVHSWAAFEEAVCELGYPNVPVCFKKPVGTGAQGFRVLDPSADRVSVLLNRNPDSTVTTLEAVAPLLRPLDPFPELIVLEYLPGDEYDVDVLARDGETLVAIPRRNERMLWGLSLVSRAEEHAGIIALTKQVVRSLGLSYVVSPSFKLDRNGDPKLIEINPRIPGSIIAAVGAGVNMPYLAVKLALGESFDLPPVAWGSRMIRYWDEAIISPDGVAVRLPIERRSSCTVCP